MKRGRFGPMWLPVLILASSLDGGCVAPARVDHLDVMLQQLVTRQLEQAKRLDDWDKELGNAWSAIFCGDKVVQMFEDADKECAAPKEGADATSDAGTTCSAKNVRSAITDADTSHKGLLLNVLDRSPYEVFPIGDGAKELTPSRQRHLEKLVQTRLRTTRFVVVSRPDEKEPQPDLAAIQRAKVVLDQLRALGVPDNLIRKWNIPFQMTKQQAARFKSQLNTAEPSNIDHSVWVFRVNC